MFSSKLDYYSLINSPFFPGSALSEELIKAK